MKEMRVYSLNLLGGVILGSFALACNSSASEAACPRYAEQCPESCQTVRAQRWNTEKNCREDRIFGCDAPNGDDDDFACYIRRSNGEVWLGSAAVLAGESFDRCDDATQKQAMAAPVGCGSP